ncbi:MAG: 4-alpha-glucanotransferase [Oscillospiraceae bacterium]|nr:4-alpha-glucanotransferase [Oscillospiraceae bacterium]
MRESGILLPISALPSRHGIGKLGKAAFDFVDFLAKSGCRYWQILPLSPTGYGDSPYQSCSVFAGNPYLIDFDLLAAKGWLCSADYDGLEWDTDASKIDYERLYRQVLPVLQIAFRNFQKRKPSGYRKFCTVHKRWLDCYALFMAIKTANNGKPWFEWDPSLAQYEASAVATAKKQYAEEIAFHQFIQYCFFTQWEALKQYANDHGIQIVGDIPIYAAYDSAEVWAEPKLFQLDDEKRPTVVAGCPPDAFATTGQLWGNPIWNWDAMKANGYQWWLNRLAFTMNLYDVVRIDHFRGFERYYAVPYGAQTAEHGKWYKGPDYALWQAAKARFGTMHVIAEDLGNITPAVIRLLKRTGFPGMKVLQFGFDSDAQNPYLPHSFATPNCICYTGTHDNPTLRGWIKSNSAQTNAYAMQYLAVKKESQLPKAMVRAAWSSIANIAIAPIQDFFNAPPSDRINTPSTLGGNWCYRTAETDYTEKLCKKIRKLNDTYGRTASTVSSEPADVPAKEAVQKQ